MVARRSLRLRRRRIRGASSDLGQRSSNRGRTDGRRWHTVFELLQLAVLLVEHRLL